MKEELEKKLFDDFPEMLSVEHLPFGLEVEDGWHDLIREMCEKLQSVREENSSFLFLQVKEKLGGLRAYASCYTEAEREIVDYYEDKSFEVCERCGVDAKRKSINGWLTTICDQCHHIRCFENWRYRIRTLNYLRNKLEENGCCHQCCNPMSKGMCNCGFSDHEDVEWIAEEERKIVKALGDFRKEHIIPLRKEGLCVQCEKPWHDGMCECGLYNNPYVVAYRNEATPYYMKVDNLSSEE